MEGVKERLIQFLAYKKLGQAAFEKTVDLSNGFVNNIGDSIRSKSIKKISDVYPDLNIAWLIVGEQGGEMLISQKQQKTQPKPGLAELIGVLENQNDILRQGFNLDDAKRTIEAGPESPRPEAPNVSPPGSGSGIQMPVKSRKHVNKDSGHEADKSHS